MQNRILKQNIGSFPREYLMLRFKYFSIRLKQSNEFHKGLIQVSLITHFKSRYISYLSQNTVISGWLHKLLDSSHAFFYYHHHRTYKTCKLNSNWVWSSLKRKRTNKNTSGIRILFLFSFLKHWWLQLTLTKITQEV